MMQVICLPNSVVAFDCQHEEPCESNRLTGMCPSFAGVAFIVLQDAHSISFGPEERHLCCHSPLL